MSNYDVLLPRAKPRSLVDPTAAPTASKGQGVSGSGPTFDEILRAEVSGQVKVSAHASARLARRGIKLDAVQLDRIGRAMDQVAAKGGRESVLIGEEAVFVVSVPNRTVITAVPNGEREADSVFTNIDSAVVMR